MAETEGAAWQKQKGLYDKNRRCCMTEKKDAAWQKQKGGCMAVTHLLTEAYEHSYDISFSINDRKFELCVV
jgi:hypothetical protein